jgi:hypothetical protein
MKTLFAMLYSGQTDTQQDMSFTFYYNVKKEKKTNFLITYQFFLSLDTEQEKNC